MPIRVFFAVIFWLLGPASGFAQIHLSEPLPKPKLGDKIGPLVLRDVERTNGWIGVIRDPKASPSMRRIGDKTLLPPEGQLSLSIQLDGIGPRLSSDAIENDAFRQQFNDGVKTLLANHRTFWFQVTNSGYAAPGQIGGVFLLDDENRPTIEEEMIRCGYAVTSPSDPMKKSSAYWDDFRDKLLRLEGEAHAYHLGIWAPRLDPALLPPDKALERLEQVAEDPKQPSDVREKTIQRLFKDGDQNKYVDLAINFASEAAEPIRRSEAFRYCAQACRLNALSESNRKKYLEYVYGLLRQIDDGHGNGYFLAMDIGTCIGIKPTEHTMRPFCPNPKLPQYKDSLGNLKPSYFQDTVTNALNWWNDHEAEYP